MALSSGTSAFDSMSCAMLSHRALSAVSNFSPAVNFRSDCDP
jgi:hypothetical protein